MQNHYADALGLGVGRKGGAVADFFAGVASAPRGRLPAPASRATWEGIGARLSMTKAIGGCRGVVPMLCARPDRARTAQLAISSRGRPCPQDRLPHTQLPHHRMSVAEGSERD